MVWRRERKGSVEPFPHAQAFSLVGHTFHVTSKGKSNIGGQKGDLRGKGCMDEGSAATAPPAATDSTPSCPPCCHFNLFSTQVTMPQCLQLAQPCQSGNWKYPAGKSRNGSSHQRCRIRRKLGGHRRCISYGKPTAESQAYYFLLDMKPPLSKCAHGITFYPHKAPKSEPKSSGKACLRSEPQEKLALLHHRSHVGLRCLPFTLLSHQTCLYSTKAAIKSINGLEVMENLMDAPISPLLLFF